MIVYCRAIMAPRLLQAVLATGLACCVLGGAVDASAAGVSVEAASAEQRDQAQRKFTEGMKAFDAKRYDQALEGFRASYDIVASPNSHLMIARALREKGDLVLAYREMQQVHREASAAAAADKKYEKTEQAARAELAEMAKRLGFVVVQLEHAPAGVTVTVAGETVAPDQLGQPLVVAPGQVAIVATAPGEAPVEQTLSIEAGATEPVTLAFAEPQPAAPPPSAPSVEFNTSKMDMRTWSYVAGGVGVAGLVTFAVFGGLNQAKYNDLQDACPNNRCPPDRQSDIDAGKAYQTAANVGLGVGILGLGTGTVLYLLSNKSSAEQQNAAAKVPMLVVGRDSVTVQGTF